MAADEDMAASFYKTGDAPDLACKLADVLESPELQQQMAAQNFSAAVRMTMPSVVRRYLRWFALAERKRALASWSEPQPASRWQFRTWRSPSLSLPSDGSQAGTSIAGEAE